MITKVGALIRDKGLEVIAVDSEASVAQAVNKMVERNIGAVLSIRDVVRAQVSSLEAEVHYLKEFITSAG